MSTSDYAQLERVSRRSLRMYDLTERERRVSDVIIDYSFARGRETALIPELQAFVDLTGLDKGDVSRALQRLIDRGIVQMRGSRDSRVYAFIPSAAFWRERKPLYDVARAVARAQELDRLNELAPIDRRGQRQLPLPQEPGLDDGIALAAREDALGENAEEPSRAESLTVLSIGESPTTGAVGKSPTTGRVGESPISPITYARACARGDSQQIVQIGDSYESGSNVAPGGSVRAGLVVKRFRDEEKNYILEQLASLDPREFTDETCRRTWIGRVRDSSKFVMRAIGVVKEDLREGKRYHRPLGKVFLKAREFARAAGREFRLW